MEILQWFEINPKKENEIAITLPVQSLNLVCIEKRIKKSKPKKMKKNHIET